MRPPISFLLDAIAGVAIVLVWQLFAARVGGGAILVRDKKEG